MLSLDMNLYHHNCRNYSRDVSKSSFRHHHTLNHANNNNSNDCKIILRDYPIHNANAVNTLPSFPTTVRHIRHSHNTPQTTFSDHSGNRSDSHDTRDGVEADGQGHGLRRLFQREPTPAPSRRPSHPPGCLQLPSPYDYDYDHHNITHTPCSMTHSTKQQSYSHSVHASAFPTSTMDKDNSIRVNSTTDHRHHHPDHSVMEAFFKNMVNDLLSDDSDSPSRNHDNGHGHNHDYVSSRSSPCSTISTTSTESFDDTSVMRTNALPPVSHSPPSMLDFDQSTNSTVDQQSLQGQRVDDNYYRHLHQHQQHRCHHQYAESSTPTLFTTSGQLISSDRTPQDHIVMSGRMVRGRPFTSTLLSSTSSSSSGYCGSSSSSSSSSSPPRRWAPVSSSETSPSAGSGGSDSDGGGCVDGFTTNSLQPLHYNLYVRSSGQQTPGTGPSTTAWTNTSKHPVNMESSRTSTPATTNTSTPSPTSHLTSPAPTTGDKIQHNHSRRVSAPTTTKTATSAGDENFNFVIAQTRQALGKLLPLGRKQHCKFCKNNKEHYGVYSTHVLNDEEGRVVCPILQKYTCPLCGATGSDAHTVKYCPWNEFDISDAMDKMLRE